MALRTYFAVVATNMMLRRRMTTILMVVLILEMLVVIAADGEMSHCDDGVHDGQAKSGKGGQLLLLPAVLLPALLLAQRACLRCRA